MKLPSILIIDDEPLMRLSIMDALKAVGYEVRAAASGHEGMALLNKGSFDLVITDLRLPGADGLTLLQAYKQRSPRTEVIVITAHGSMDSAVEAMKLGAYDYITKPFSMDELLLIVERLSKVLALRQETQAARQEADGTFGFRGVVGRSDAMHRLLQGVKSLAGGNGPVLIVGEVGTGKELVANAVHRNSPRRDHALIKVSCGGLRDDVLEAELFGHEKGALAGAVRQRRGRFELAHKGTLFLDEIAGLSAGIQARLVKVLKHGKLQRIGGREPLEVDVRVVCGTATDLAEGVRAGRFRQDLYDALHAATLLVPPLRERPDDVLLIAEHVLRIWGDRKGKTFKGFSQAAQDMLRRYSYPGNVRELEHIVERAVALGRATEEIQAWDLCGLSGCPMVGGTPQPSCGFCREGLSGRSTHRPDKLAEATDQFERQYIRTMLVQAGWSRQKAATMLGLSVPALEEKCRRYGLNQDGETTE